MPETADGGKISTPSCAAVHAIAYDSHGQRLHV